MHDDVPLSKWKLAVITDLLKEKDGLVRAAKIKMNGLETSRPIVKLYPLEVTMDIFSPESHESDGQSAYKNCDRPKREASERARQNIRDCLSLS